MTHDNGKIKGDLGNNINELQLQLKLKEIALTLNDYRERAFDTNPFYYQFCFRAVDLVKR